MSDRAEFEKSIIRRFPYMGLSLDATGGYVDLDACQHWETWQAARAQGGEGEEPVGEVGMVNQGGTGTFTWSGYKAPNPNDKLYTQPQSAVPMRDLCYLYWSAYHSGHSDTVEGQYTDVVSVDRFDYWKDAVQECLESCDMPGIDTPQPADGWIKCSERLPTEADADCEGVVWVTDGEIVYSGFYGHLELDDSHLWMPTDLKRPNPPEQGAE